MRMLIPSEPGQEYVTGPAGSGGGMDIGGLEGSRKLAGRSKEMTYLERFYQREGSGLIILYGKRGIGKTTLLKAFCADRDSCFYRARACGEREQAFLWGAELRNDGYELNEYPDYEDILQQLTAQRKFLAGSPANRRGKKIIVIDEFQHLVKNSASFFEGAVKMMHNPGIKQGVLFIMCSSSIGWVENSMVSRLGTAAFEISGFLKIRELGYAELFSYFQDYPSRQCMETYAVLGGVPGYWNYFDPALDFEENICRNFLADTAPLKEEAENLVSRELRETGVYDTLLAAIAAGRHKLNELYLHTGYSRAKISVYLKNLMELELVEKVFSYDTEGRDNAQKGIYRISDSLVQFYFHYLYPNLSILTGLGIADNQNYSADSGHWNKIQAKEYYERYIGPTLQEYVGGHFAKACVQYLEKENSGGRLAVHYVKSGEWVGKTGIIDFIGQDEAGRTIVAGCHYGKGGMTTEDYEWFLFCVKQACLEPEAVYLFAMEGFDGRLKEAAEKDEKVYLTEWRNLYI